MQITPEQLLDEAAHMALELRLKDRAIAALEAENARLREQFPPEEDDGRAAGEAPPSAEPATA